MWRHEFLSVAGWLLSSWIWTFGECYLNLSDPNLWKSTRIKSGWWKMGSALLGRKTNDLLIFTDPDVISHTALRAKKEKKNLFTENRIISLKVRIKPQGGFGERWWINASKASNMPCRSPPLSVFMHWALRCSPGSSFQEPLIASFSHCCWQFSTSVLWEPLQPDIVFFLSACFSLVRGHFTLLSPTSSPELTPISQLETTGTLAFVIIPRMSSLEQESVHHLSVKCGLINCHSQHQLKSSSERREQNTFPTLTQLEACKWRFKRDKVQISSQRLSASTASEGWGDYGQSMRGWTEDDLRINHINWAV